LGNTWNLGGHLLLILSGTGSSVKSISDLDRFLPSCGSVGKLFVRLIIFTYLEFSHTHFCRRHINKKGLRERKRECDAKLEETRIKDEREKGVKAGETGV